MKSIPLTQGQIALVDDEDYDDLIGLKWYAFRRKGGFYAKHGEWNHGQEIVSWMHRVVWEIHVDFLFKGIEIDHINGNTLDNRLENLRACTHAQNIRNQKRVSPHSSKFKGVCFVKQKNRWHSYITHNGRTRYIGSFISETEAAKAYDAKAQELFGEFARPNFDSPFSKVSSEGEPQCLEKNYRKSMGITSG